MGYLMAERIQPDKMRRKGSDDLTRSRVVGDSDAVQQMQAMLRTVARRQSTVLLEGESGSGKELASREIHTLSKRRDKPFVAVDCTVLRDTLLESELFGHVRGAFTGADRATLGFIRAADGGTLFLDEIGELAPAVQAKLLRCIQERKVIPVGSTESIPVDVRIVTATHRDLKKMVRDGEFREDLFYRINVVRIVIPPLRDRGEDIILLARHFLDELSRLYKEPPKFFADDILDAMRVYHWPGNIRELTNAIEYAYVLSESEKLTVANLPEGIRAAVLGLHAPVGSDDFPTLAMSERSLLVRVLRETNGNKAQAARILNVERHRFYRMVRRHGLESMAKS